VGDVVHLGVVEERVLVEVGRAEREPGVVDDADLGVHVDAIGEPTCACKQRAGDQTPRFGVGLDKFSEHPPRVVAAAVRFRRQDDQQPEVVARRPQQLVGQDRCDLRRREKLVLRVDQPPRRAQRPYVRLENAGSPSGFAL
jgi:hypothetical protein